MSDWQYTDQTARAVFRTNENGSMESYMVDAAEIQEFVNAGGQILPPPDPIIEEPTVSVDTLTNILISKGLVSKAEVDQQVASEVSLIPEIVVKK